VELKKPLQAEGPAVVCDPPGLERLPLVNGGRSCDGRHYPVASKPTANRRMCQFDLVA
jgi:hypothetical protein